MVSLFYFRQPAHPEPFFRLPTVLKYVNYNFHAWEMRPTSPGRCSIANGSSSENYALSLMTNANIKVAMPFSVELIPKIAPSRAMGIYKKKISVLLVVWFPYFGLRQCQAIEHNRPPNKGSDCHQNVWCSWAVQPPPFRQTYSLLNGLFALLSTQLLLEMNFA